MQLEICNYPRIHKKSGDYWIRWKKKKTNMFVKVAVFKEWAAELSRTTAKLCFIALICLSNFSSHLSNKKEVIHALLLALYSTGSLPADFKTCSFASKQWHLFPRTLAQIKCIKSFRSHFNTYKHPFLNARMPSRIVIFKAVVSTTVDVMQWKCNQNFLNCRLFHSSTILSWKVAHSPHTFLDTLLGWLFPSINPGCRNIFNVSSFLCKTTCFF